MKQLRTWSQRILAEDVVGRFLLEARAGQAVFIHGYRIDLAFAPNVWDGNAERYEVVCFLQAAPLANVAPANVGTEILDSLVRHRGNIGALVSGWEMTLGTAELILVPGRLTTGWVPCGFEVPGLWMVAGASQSNHTTIGTVVYTILFDWVDKTPLQMAALYTTYGIDSVDATEREVSGEIDFSKSPGDAALPTIIG